MSRIRTDLTGKCGSCTWASPVENTAYIVCMNPKMRVRRLCMNQNDADIKRRSNKACKKYYEEVKENEKE